jgi:hypothetical protein
VGNIFPDESASLGVYSVRLFIKEMNFSSPLSCSHYSLFIDDYRYIYKQLNLTSNYDLVSCAKIASLFACQELTKQMASEGGP